MSFFSKLFTRNITFPEYIGRDENYPEIVHVFGAIRIMLDEGDSFDIYRYCVLDLNTYQVTNGLEQRGNSFSIKSAFVQRAMDEMSEKLNRKLALRKEKEPEEDEDGYEIEITPEYPDLEEHCEFPVVDADSEDSDTDEPRKLPSNCLLYVKNKTGERERFTVQLIRSKVGMKVHQFYGMHDYFRHVLRFKDTGRLLCTYRKENMMGGGGIGFFVIDSATGDLLHEAMMK